MRGFPLLNGAFILLALGVILVPLLRLTGDPAETPSSSEVATEDSEKREVAMVVRYAHEPASLAISHLGEAIWETTSSAEMKQGKKVSMEIPDEGFDLFVSVEWPAGTPETALQLTLTPESLEEQTQVLWGQGDYGDVLSFVWKGASP